MVASGAQHIAHLLLRTLADKRILEAQRTKHIADSRAALRSNPIAQSDARSFANLLPFRQVLGVKNVVEAFVGQFPEE